MYSYILENDFRTLFFYNSVGSLGRLPNEMDVRGVLVTNCTFTGTTNGARIKTFAASGASRASAIVFDNLIMNNVQNPIIIDQFYSSDSSAKVSFYSNERKSESILKSKSAFVVCSVSLFFFRDKHV